MRYALLTIWHVTLVLCQAPNWSIVATNKRITQDVKWIITFMKVTKSNDDSPRVSQRQCVAVIHLYQMATLFMILMTTTLFEKGKRITSKVPFSRRCWNDCL